MVPLAEKLLLSPFIQGYYIILLAPATLGFSYVLHYLQASDMSKSQTQSKNQSKITKQGTSIRFV